MTEREERDGRATGLPSHADPAIDDDPEVGCIADFPAGSRTALVAFGGIGRFGPDPGVAPFEFRGVGASIDGATVYLRDPSRTWYRSGVPGLGPDPDTAIAALGALLERNRIERSVFTGVSAGGFAALWYGSVLGVDVVHAFVPQTSVGLSGRLMARDRRYRPNIRRMRAALPRDAGVTDVRPVVARAAATNVHVHWGDRTPADGRQARRLQSFEHVQIHEYPGVKHADLAASLLDSGVLLPMLNGALAGRSNERGPTRT
ncbi:MAG: hypothetical protein FJW95_13915 [Actinobacteria bacterium]|nr:hypothetical protein [Actinomycetota bacterium]